MTRMNGHRTSYTDRRTAWIYLPLAIYTLAVIIFGLFVAEDTVWFILLVCLPAFFIVWVTLVGGLAAALSRITLSERGVSVTAPTWRGTPSLPIRRLAADWPDVISVRRRTEIFRPAGMGGLAVRAWELKTRAGTVVFGGRIIPGIGEAMVEIAGRANVPILDEGSIDVRIIPALLHGTPDWPLDKR